MRKILLAGAALIALSTSAFAADDRKDCQDKGGHFENGKCETGKPEHGKGPGGQPGQDTQGQNTQGRGGNGPGNKDVLGSVFGKTNSITNTNGRDNGRPDNNGRDNNGRDANGGPGRPFGNNGQRFGADHRDFDQHQFDHAFYGRYGNDPGNFARDRARFRAEQHWREGYYHDYVYADDAFYRDCRNDNTVGDAIIGGLLGGLVGNAASHGNGGATVAGVIFGAGAGANFGRDLSCEDRGFLYQTYYSGFEQGRPHARYEWRDADTGRYGTLMVGDYYRDRDGFRCATYSQSVFIRGRMMTANGHACRQGDGTWAVID